MAALEQTGPWLKGKQVLLLSSVDWSSAWQRHHALAEGFRRLEARVFFVENTGFRDFRAADYARVAHRLTRLLRPKPEAPEVDVFAPMVLPPTKSAFRVANSRFFVPRLINSLRRLGLRPDPIVVAYLPTETTLSIIDSISPALTVYDCVDNFSGHPCRPSDLERTERELVRRSELVLTTSKYLFDQKSIQHPRVLQIHHGVTEAFFLRPRETRRYRRFCYFGTIWSALDFAPLLALDKAGFEVTLLGPVKEAPPRLPPSIRLPGPVPHEELPRALEEFDGLLLPYANSEYNLGVIPAKVYECLATGRPVLSSPLPSLEGLAHLLHVCASPDDFVRTAQALRETETRDTVAARVAEAEAHSTPRQVDIIVRAMEEAFLAKGRC